MEANNNASNSSGTDGCNPYGQQSMNRRVPVTERRPWNSRTRSSKSPEGQWLILLLHKIQAHKLTKNRWSMIILLLETMKVIAFLILRIYAKGLFFCQASLSRSSQYHSRRVKNHDMNFVQLCHQCQNFSPACWLEGPFSGRARWKLPVRRLPRVGRLGLTKR